MLSFTSPLFRCSSALLFLLLLASLHGTPLAYPTYPGYPAYPEPGKTQDTCDHQDTQDKTFLSASEKEAYPAKTVAKRSIFDLIPEKVEIVEKETEMASHHHHRKKKKRKVLSRARSKNKKMKLRHLIRNAFKSYYNDKRTKNHKRQSTTFNTTTATPATKTSTTATSTATTLVLLVLVLVIVLVLQE